MKNMITLISVLFALPIAQASRARISSLLSADHIIDTQTLFINPNHINFLNEQINLESNTVRTSISEGGLLKKIGSDHILGVYFSNQNLNSQSSSLADLDDRVPVELTYGMKDSALGLTLSTTNDHQKNYRETLAILKYGSKLENFDYYGHLTLISQVQDKTTSDKINRMPELLLGASTDDLMNRFYSQIYFNQTKDNLLGLDEKNESLNIKLGWLSHYFKTKQSDIYAGSSLTHQRFKLDTQNQSNSQSLSSLLFFSGVEHVFNDYWTFRGSVEKDFILDESKNQNTETELIYAVGAGLSIKQFVIDASITGSSNGGFDNRSLFSYLSAAYLF